jgi:hypothetical protein
MEPGSSLPCSQKPATCLCPSQLYPVHSFPSYSPHKHFNIILLSTPTNFTPVSTPKPLHTALHSPHTCNMPSSSHPPYNKRSVPCTKRHYYIFCCILQTEMSQSMSPNLWPDPWHRKFVAVLWIPTDAAAADSSVWYEPRSSGGGDNSGFFFPTGYLLCSKVHVLTAEFANDLGKWLELRQADRSFLFLTLTNILHLKYIRLRSSRVFVCL